MIRVEYFFIFALDFIVCLKAIFYAKLDDTLHYLSIGKGSRNFEPFNIIARNNSTLILVHFFLLKRIFCAI